MSTYMRILLLIHIGGAIVGLGPTAAFGIMGKMSGEVGPGGVHILEAMVKIERVLVTGSRWSWGSRSSSSSSSWSGSPARRNA